MAGPEASQQNIAQNIKLPLLAYLPPIVHPGVMSSPSKTHIHLAVHMMLKKMELIRPGHLLLFHWASLHPPTHISWGAYDPLGGSLVVLL